LAAEEIALSAIRIQAGEGKVSNERADAAARLLPCDNEEERCDHRPRQDAFRPGIEVIRAGLGLIAIASLVAVADPKSEPTGA